MTRPKETVCCYCGCMAEVYEWNSKGIMVGCQNCNTYEMDRDTLYRRGMWFTGLARDIGKSRDFYLSCIEDPNTDPGYKAVCEEVVPILNDMMEKVNDRLKSEWGEWE